MPCSSHPVSLLTPPAPHTPCSLTPPAPHTPPGLDVVLLLYVSLLGSAASYGVFFYNASRGNLTALSSLTFLTPCFAAAIGYGLLGETLTPLQLGGGALTLAAVTLVNQNHEPGEEKEEGAGEQGK